MLQFTEEQDTIRKLIRRWTTSKLEPKLDALETGEPPYELMRDFARQFGIADLARSAFAKIEQRAKADCDGVTGADECDPFWYLYAKPADTTPQYCLEQQSATTSCMVGNEMGCVDGQTQADCHPSSNRVPQSESA